MHLTKPSPSNAGNTLVTVLIIGVISTIMISSMLALSSSSVRNSHGRADWNAAFYQAENALQWAAQSIADITPVASSNYYSTADNTLGIPYMMAARADAGSGLKNVWVNVSRPNPALPNNYVVTTSA